MGLIRTALIFAAGYALGRPDTREKVVSQAQQLWQRDDVQQLKQRGTQTVSSTVQQVKEKTPLGKGDGSGSGTSTVSPRPVTTPVPPPVPPTPATTTTSGTTASVPPVPPDLADPPLTPPIPPADPIKPIDPLGEKPLSGRPSTPPA